MEKSSFDPLAIYRKAQGSTTLFGHVMIALMMLSFGVSVALFGARLINGWTGVYMIVLSLLVSLEAIYTRAQTKEMDLRERAIFHLSEWVAIAVVLKLLLYLEHGPAQLLRDIPRWQANFIESFFTGEYMLSLLTIMIVWFVSRAYAGEMEELYSRENDAVWDELGKLQNELHAIRSRISARVYIIGTAVVILSVLSRLDVSIILRQRGAGFLLAAPVINVVAYFLMALVLLSHTQFSLLRTRWIWQRLTISPKLAGNWLKYGFLSFLILAVIVLFLPTGYSIGLLDTLRYVFEYLMQAVSFLMFLFTLPFTACLSLLSLLGSGDTSTMQPVQPSPLTVNPRVPSSPIGWLEVLRSLLFWSIFLAVIFFALRYYLSQNAALWNAITRFPLFRWFKGIIGGLWKWVKGANRQVTGLVQQGIQRLRASRKNTPGQAIRRMFNLARMSPREKIIYFYLSLIQLGGERGLERKPSQTPYAYENRLSSNVPEIDPDLHRLTDTFLEARYSEHQIDPPQSEMASTLWEQIKAALKRWKPEE